MKDELEHRIPGQVSGLDPGPRCGQSCVVAEGLDKSGVSFLTSDITILYQGYVKTSVKSTLAFDNIFCIILLHDAT
jgi:hypothetical protein